jgi:hypothetical protein
MTLGMSYYYKINRLVSEVDPESGNCGSSHIKRPFIRDETELIKLN